MQDATCPGGDHHHLLGHEIMVICNSQRWISLPRCVGEKIVEELQGRPKHPRWRQAWGSGDRAKKQQDYDSGKQVNFLLQTVAIVWKIAFSLCPWDSALQDGVLLLLYWKQGVKPRLRYTVSSCNHRPGRDTLTNFVSSSWEHHRSKNTLRFLVRKRLGKSRND